MALASVQELAAGDALLEAAKAGHCEAVLRALQADAKAGKADAQFQLGAGAQEGHCLVKSADQAFSWYYKAADQGHADAQYALGVAYDRGLGVDVNTQSAAYWMRKAAMQGHAKAQQRLGLFHETGRGVVKDAALAVEWYRKAAEQGDEIGRAHV